MYLSLHIMNSWQYGVCQFYKMTISIPICLHAWAICISYSNAVLGFCFSDLKFCGGRGCREGHRTDRRVGAQLAREWHGFTFWSYKSSLHWANSFQKMVTGRIYFGGGKLGYMVLLIWLFLTGSTEALEFGQKKLTPFGKVSKYVEKLEV